MGELLIDSTNNGEALPAVWGHDHASLALMPFVASRDTEARQGQAEFSYQTNLDGRVRRVSYTLIPSEGGELPTQYDQPVFLALLQLWLRDDNADTRMAFHRSEVMDLLRWPRGGDYYERLVEALDRLTGLTIRTEAALVARNGREYAKARGAAHLIDRYHLDSGRDPQGFVVWGDLVHEAREIGDFKRLNWDLLLSLADPVATQLYRVLDRATLSGCQEWSVGWRTLCTMLGMSPSGYKRPAKFKDRVSDRIDALVGHQVIDGWRYDRGGVFIFHVRNHLRSELRRVLAELGVYDKAADQLLTGYDEMAIMQQCDCLLHGSRTRADAPAGYLVEAARQGYPLVYPDDEPEKFMALWGMLGPVERKAYHQAGLRLCGAGENLLDTNEDPTAWEVEFRAVVRFMVCHNLDPEEVARRQVPALVRGTD